MPRNNVLKKENTNIIVKVNGKNLEQIFNKAFEKMRILAYKNFNNLIVSLQTQEVWIISEFDYDTHANKINKDVEIEFKVQVQYIDVNNKKG